VPNGHNEQPERKSPPSQSVYQWKRLLRFFAGRLYKIIKQVSAEKRFVQFARIEIDKMRAEINTTSASRSYRKTLYEVIEGIERLLTQLEEKQPNEKRNEVSIYQFKVTLREIEPPIWRRIQVPDCTLGKLHVVLKSVMGWKDRHLHRFIIRGKHYRAMEAEDCRFGSERFDEDVNSINEVIPVGKRSWFIYKYGIGDGWQHRVVLEKTLESEPMVHHPRCVDVARACPPEGVGGTSRYAEFVKALVDPKHQSYEDMLRSDGGSFDPEEFSVDEVNKVLRTCCCGSMSRG
jgi:hypothetical protein